MVSAVKMQEPQPFVAKSIYPYRDFLIVYYPQHLRTLVCVSSISEPVRDDLDAALVLPVMVAYILKETFQQ